MTHMPGPSLSGNIKVPTPASRGRNQGSILIINIQTDFSIADVLGASRNINRSLSRSAYAASAASRTSAEGSGVYMGRCKVKNAADLFYSFFSCQAGRNRSLKGFGVFFTFQNPKARLRAVELANVIASLPRRGDWLVILSCGVTPFRDGKKGQTSKTVCSKKKFREGGLWIEMKVLVSILVACGLLCMVRPCAGCLTKKFHGIYPPHQSHFDHQKINY
ncbi:hypothetical protein NA56DRAFT_2534 [Hyaloscypha hepaticicola]|uniref:Uncharacterized protein n=1 Tax=Hyaloscypha hepaticicola TaxID=2082293 RepID=A0A2J6QPG7_9HELO|nr:hypothetical protein NA56DRAFT_2534 [Hyaloscypha hepaticicola]